VKSDHRRQLLAPEVLQNQKIMEMLRRRKRLVKLLLLRLLKIAHRLLSLLVKRKRKRSLPKIQLRQP
jgi:hypothetical protein